MNQPELLYKTVKCERCGVEITIRHKYRIGLSEWKPIELPLCEKCRKELYGIRR